MKIISLILCFFTMSYLSGAQTFDAAYFRKNLSGNNVIADTGADGIVLYERGDVHIFFSGERYQQAYHVHRIIKILRNTPEALALGDIREVYGRVSGGNDFARNLKGTTYNLEGTELQTATLDATATYDKKVHNGYHELAFAMPAVRAGCIIDYEYEVITRIHDILPTWVFRDRLPKLVSEYELVAPSLFEFHALRNGNLAFKEYSSLKEAEKDGAAGYKVNLGVAGKNYSVLWGRKNIPALRKEPWISSLDNYAQRLELQYSGYNNDEYLSTWKEFDKDLWESPSFGRQIRDENKFLDKVVDSVTKNDDTPLKKAQSIFSYVRGNFECNRFNAIGGDHNVEETFNDKKGNDEEVNLLLAAMLVKAGIRALPVLVSKVGHLRASENYPFLNMFNYVVCVVNMETDQYFLDATDKFNRFGVLPHYCYNGYARIMDEEGKGVMLTPDKLTDVVAYKVDISRITDTTMQMDVRERSGAVTGRKLRGEIGKDSAFLKNYIDKRITALHMDAELRSSTTDNPDNPEKDLVIRYSLRIRRPQTETTSYIATDFIPFFEKNPFTAAERALPVEFGYKRSYQYALDMLLPPGYTVDDMPAATEASVNGALKFTHTIAYDSSSRMVSVVASYSVNLPTLAADSYPEIKAFFDKMTEAQKGVLVIKKSGK